MGNVTAASRVRLWRTLCTDNGNNIHGQWPFDVLSCDIELGMLGQSTRLRAVPVNAVRPADSEDTSGWHLQQVILLNETIYDVYDGENDLRPTGACDIVYRLTLRRNSDFYVRVFVSPLLVAHVLMLASFCGGVRIRGALCALALTLTAVVLLLAGQYTPNSYVPLLIRWYEATLWLAWLACVLFIVDRRLAAAAAATGETKNGLLTVAWVRILFGLDAMNVSNGTRQI